jgi:hypothetical protein
MPGTVGRPGGTLGSCAPSGRSGDEGPCGEVPKTLTVGARGRWSAGVWSGTVGPMSECDAGRHVTSGVSQ